jgi:hypothetical protein
MGEKFNLPYITHLMLLVFFTSTAVVVVYLNLSILEILYGILHECYSPHSRDGSFKV